MLIAENYMETELPLLKQEYMRALLTSLIEDNPNFELKYLRHCSYNPARTFTVAFKSSWSFEFSMEGHRFDFYPNDFIMCVNSHF